MAVFNEKVESAVGFSYLVELIEFGYNSKLYT
jgi:hypothetical protein